MNIRLATLDDIEALVSLRIQLLEANDASFDGGLRAWLRTISPMDRFWPGSPRTPGR